MGNKKTEDSLDQALLPMDPGRRGPPAAKSHPRLDFFLQFLRRRDERKVQDLSQELEHEYQRWSQLFELMKREFNRVSELFAYIEANTPGWYCTSPNEAKWQAVGLSKGGYNFAAGIMKNHSPTAPFAEKSLAVSFGFENTSQGMGDERLLGYPGPITDSLAGLAACTGKNLPDKLREVRRIAQKAWASPILVRMQHFQHGQQSTRLEISILDKYSLVEICEKLFYAVNHDMISELGKELSGVDAPLLTGQLKLE